MKIPFSPPLITNAVKDEVMDSLDSGWITTGPKVKQLESQIREFSGAPEVVCVNSWTSGALLVLKWLELGPDDEVIIPAYTYSATALAVIHAGAKPVIVDVKDDFNISVEEIEKAITKNTKAIMPVDIAGWPCDYQEINQLAQKHKNLYTANNQIQEKLGRILVVTDAAHSIGAKYQGIKNGSFTDITIFSLHAVKNVTTAEGGAICLNLPKPFDNSELYQMFRCYSLNGQTKDAFTKSKAGAWKYDIVYPGLKINLPDVLAAIGVGQMKDYGLHILPKRQEIFEQYNAGFENKPWAILPPFKSKDKTSSCHLYALRIKDATEEDRDKIIELISMEGVAVNVHFQPLPLLHIFKEMGFNINDYPMAYSQYRNEISLPIYPQLDGQKLDYIIDVVTTAVEKMIK